MTRQDFDIRLDEMMQRHPAFRRGQVAFELAYEINSDLADSVRGTELDPFYIDARLDDFAEWFLKQDH